MAVHYTPGQLRSAVALPQETYRHWKKTLPPLRLVSGHSPCFTAGDLLALALVRTMTANFSMRVSAIAPISEQLFQICNASPWPVLERSTLIVDFLNNCVELISDYKRMDSETPLFVFPLSSVVRNLRNALLSESEQCDQRMFHFAPIPLVSSGEPISSGGRS